MQIYTCQITYFESYCLNYIVHVYELVGCLRLDPLQLPKGYHRTCCNISPPHNFKNAFWKAHSAEAAVQQAKGAGEIAVWSKEKLILKDIGDIGQKQPGNRGRDLARHLHKRGFMLNIPISYLKNVFWRWFWKAFVLSDQPSIPTSLYFRPASNVTLGNAYMRFVVLYIF